MSNGHLVDPDADRLVQALEIIGRHALDAAASIRTLFDTPVDAGENQSDPEAE